MLIRVRDYIVNTDNVLFACSSDPVNSASSVELFFPNTSLVLDGVGLDDLWHQLNPPMTLVMEPGEDPVDFLNRITEQGGQD